jgi:hypothetical protein
LVSILVIGEDYGSGDTNLVTWDAEYILTRTTCLRTGPSIRAFAASQASALDL